MVLVVDATVLVLVTCMDVYVDAVLIVTDDMVMLVVMVVGSMLVLVTCMDVYVDAVLIVADDMVMLVVMVVGSILVDIVAFDVIFDTIGGIQKPLTHIIGKGHALEQSTGLGVMTVDTDIVLSLVVGILLTVDLTTLGVGNVTKDVTLVFIPGTVIGTVTIGGTVNVVTNALEDADFSSS